MSFRSAGLADFHHDARFRQSEALYFTVRADDPRADYLTEDVELRWNGRRFYIAERVASRFGSVARIEIEAVALWNRLADDRKIGAFVLPGSTAFAGLSSILDGTDWTPVLPDAAVDTATLYNLDSNDATVLDLLWKWAKITGYELTFDSIAKTVALVTEIGADRGVGFRYARNVVAVERRARPPAATVLYPFGREDVNITGLTGGVPYLEDFTYYTAQGLTLTEARARYTRKTTRVDRTFTTPEDLYTAGQRWMAELAQPRVTYTMNVLDLSELTGLPADSFALGDRVRVTDDVLGYDVTVRVVRIDRYPYQPDASTVELSYLDPKTPDPNVGGSRTSPAEEWTLFERANHVGEQLIRDGSTILQRLPLATVEGGEWIIGATINGTGVGSGEVTLELMDDATGIPFGPEMTATVTDGAPFHWSFSIADREVTAEDHTLTVRAHSSGAGIGVDIPEKGTALWVLAKGTTGRSITLPNSQLFSYTGAVQQFVVPDDVTELLVELVGGSGQCDDVRSSPGEGGKIVFRHPCLPGSTLDVYVGGSGGGGLGGLGWPNGGLGDATGSGNQGGQGGGSTHITEAGNTFANAWGVAPGGGGSGFAYTSGMQGGRGGFVRGTDATGGVTPGFGGSQDAGGAAGGPGATAGASNAGGAAGNTTNSFAGPGGGGGGGRNGGGGAGEAGFAGAGGEAGGGGGGAGWIDADAYDLETQDGAGMPQSPGGTPNTGDGYALISWETPLD